MGVEIERKFLVRDSRWRAAATRSVAMAQGYLGGERCSVRVRLEGEAAFLNIKTAVPGVAREEFEYPIPADDARAMLALYCPAQVVKRRHHVPHGGHLWEVDAFEGDNAGLVVAEIELARPDEPFARPDWLGEEVSGEHRFYNVRLAGEPFARWPDRDRFLVRD